MLFQMVIKRIADDLAPARQQCSGGPEARSCQQACPNVPLIAGEIATLAASERCVSADATTMKRQSRLGAELD